MMRSFVVQCARRDLFAHIEGYYNRRRIHSAIGHITPQQAEAKYA
jgi:transposase InsO family protein